MTLVYGPDIANGNQAFFVSREWAGIPRRVFVATTRIACSSGFVSSGTSQMSRCNMARMNLLKARDGSAIT